MRVLVGTPTWGDGPRAETGRSIDGQTLRGNLEWLVVRENPYPIPDMRNVVAAYQAIRERFLAGAWDALLTVEHDMILPGDALERLWELEKPVTYGVYLLRHGAAILNAWQYIGDRNLGESLTFARHYSRGTPEPKPGVPLRVSGVGFGCTLIRREVVERFPFHDGGQTGATAPDLPFALDCLRAGVEQWAHFGVLCGHMEDGRTLWPFRDELGVKVRAIALQAVTVSILGQSTRLEVGREYEMPREQAHELSRAGYVRVVEEQAPAEAQRRGEEQGIGERDGAARDRDANVQAAGAAAAKRRKPAAAKR